MEAVNKKANSMDAQNDLTFEPCIFGKAKVWLPVDLIEDPSIFKSVVSQETWDKVLTDEDRKKLIQLMPTFPEGDDDEKEETLRCLFEEENINFGNPLVAFRERLRAGFMNPEIHEMEQALHRATYQDYKFSQQRRLHRLLKEVLISRQELLEAALFTSPSAPVPVKRRLYCNDKAVDGVVEKKFRKMLASSKEEDSTPSSSDEGESRVEMNGFHHSPAESRNLDLLLGPKWTDFWPSEYDLQEEARTHSTFDPKPSHVEGKPPSPVKPLSPARVTQQQYIRMIEDYQDRMEDEHLRKHPELNTKNIKLTGIITRSFPLPPPPQIVIPGMLPKAEDTNLKMGKKRKDKEKDKKKRKKKKMAATAPMSIPPKSTTPVSTGSIELHSPIDIMSTPESRPSTRDDMSISPATCSPASAGSSSSDIKPPLRVHPSFFSLIRDIFSAAPNHRLTIVKLRESLASWQRSPVSMLSTWAILQPSWAKVVDGAMLFLNGEIDVSPDVIPRVRFDDERQMWQWRSELPPDSEEELVTLFKQWLDTLPGMRSVPPKPKETTTSTDDTSEPATVIPTAPVTIDIKIPVTKSFAEQERERYSQPHKAFVYQMPGYQAIVGPVKGVFGKDTNLNKAREHALLISDRPSYVTILSLVRDAVARLPNGEGTRATVCELLKDSQYLAESSDSQINNVVSGALDRLHYEKDPCIKYDVNRKLWIYLHHHRTLAEFERLHQEQAAEVKARKSIARQTKLLPKMTPGLRDSPLNFQSSRPGSALSDTSSDNLSIEVCSPKASPGRAVSPKPSRKSPAYVKTTPMLGMHGHGDGPPAGMVSSVSRADHQGAPGSFVPSGGKIIPGQMLGQSPFVISPQKMGTLQSALRGLHPSPGIMSTAGGDSFIKAQLLAAKASSGATVTAVGPDGLPVQPGASVSSIANILRGSLGDVASRIPTSGMEAQAEALRNMPKLMKGMSVPCTLADGKVVMIPPEFLMTSGKASKKRARSSSGGRKKGNTVQMGEANAAVSIASDLSKSLSAVSPSTVTVSQGTSKGGRKSATASPSPLTIGANKLATVSEALAQKRAEAALQSGRQQGRGQSTITLPPGALKGQTVKSILASVGIPMSGASVTVSRIDTPGTTSSGKQGATKKDNRKSPVFSGVNIVGSQQTPKGRPSSTPTMSGKKSPITSMHHAFGHQAIGLTTVTKGGQIMMQPIAVGIDRPGSAASPGMARQSASQAAQALTIKAIPVSLGKANTAPGAVEKDTLKSEYQFGTGSARTGLDERDGAVKGRVPKISKQHFVSGAAAAAALSQAGKMARTDLKDFASVPLSVLLPGAQQGGMGGGQKGGLPVLSNPFLAGGQIPLASLTDGKGVIFQMPHGSNIMSLPMQGGQVSQRGTLGTSSSGQIPSSAAMRTTTVPTSSHYVRTPSQGVRPHSLQMQLSSVTPSTLKSVGTAKHQRTGSPALPPNIVTATIRSALAAAQSRANPSHSQPRGFPAQSLSASQLLQAQSASAAIRASAQHSKRVASTSSGMLPAQMRMTSTTGSVSSPMRFPSSASQSRPSASASDSRTSSLTASSIASIIANLKQNPMAAISLPSMSSLSPALSTATARSSQPSGMSSRTAPTVSSGPYKTPTASSAASGTPAQLVASHHPANVKSQSPTLARTLSQPSSLSLPTSSYGFARTLSEASAMSRASSQSSMSSPSLARTVSHPGVSFKSATQPSASQFISTQQTFGAAKAPSSLGQPATSASPASTTGAVQVRTTLQTEIKNTSAPAATVVASQPAAAAPLQRIIPPFEPRVTRGQTKGKDKTPKKDT